MTLRIKPGSHRELIFQEVHSNPRSASGGQFAKDIVFKILSLSDGRKGEKRKMNFGDIFQKTFILYHCELPEKLTLDGFLV